MIFYMCIYIVLHFMCIYNCSRLVIDPLRAMHHPACRWTDSEPGLDGSKPWPVPPCAAASMLNMVCWVYIIIPLKNMNVRWDYYSQYMEKHVPNHQPGIHYIMGLYENSVSHIPMDYHHVPHQNFYLWASPIFRQTRMHIYLLTRKMKVKNSLLDPVTTYFQFF